MEALGLSICRKANASFKTMEHSNPREISLVQFAVEMCRKHRLLKDRVTLVSPSDFLQILQLCQALAHKKIGIGFQADNKTLLALAQAVYGNKQRKAIAEGYRLLQNNQSTHDITPSCIQQDFHGNTPHDSSQAQQSIEENIIQCNKAKLEQCVLQEYDKFLINSNHVDPVDVLHLFLLELLKTESEIHADMSSVHFECTGGSHDPLQELVFQLMKGDRNVTEGGNADPSFIENCLAICAKPTPKMALMLVLEGTETYTTVKPCSSPPETNEETNLSKELVKELIRSYLHLLVNTRSELAFAHVFNSPDRELTHQAFTHLKHQAQKKNMSLYQTAMSVVMHLRLGGSGYAPDPHNKLLQHVKGLGLLSELMNKLQQLLEDTVCVRSSVVRVVGAVKKNLIGCKSQRYKRETVETVASEIQKDLEQTLHRLQLSTGLISPDKPACQGGSLTSRRPGRVLLHYLDWSAATLWACPHAPHHTWLQDIPFGPCTPSRFPCVLSQFRSPAESCSSSFNKVEEEEKAHNKKQMTLSSNLSHGADQTLLQRCAKRLSDDIFVIPSKTIMHPGEGLRLWQDENKDGCDKENVLPSTSPARKVGRKASTSDCASPAASGQKKAQSRVIGTQHTKRATKPAKKVRRRLLSPGKGQKSITSFFRV